MELEVFVEPTYLELQKIDNITASLFGGIVQYQEALAQLESIRDSIAEPSKESIQKDPYLYNIYFGIQESIARAYLYSKIKVTLTPPIFNIDELTREELDDLISAYEVALEPFRDKKKKLRKAS
jgi:hypothetical protein